MLRTPHLPSTVLLSLSGSTNICLVQLLPIADRLTL
jgi:hypothetical protein